MSNFDSKALASAREVITLTRQEHIGGEVQLLAKIQCLFIEAMEYAAPQSFGNSEQLNSPAVPDGWVMVPIEPTAEMCKAFDYSNAWKEVDFWEGSFDLASGWRAMLAAAPKQESE
ncbi:hypothetical protein [Pseudescherichia sp.]|uniref:hypothetical protein n=1 Tax=Pseudescherichia sp. TaxID=2055881 RepID=UPI0028A63E20|nr:hypothetical protein [Pseudescherichia sp.]